MIYTLKDVIDSDKLDVLYKKFVDDGTIAST